MCFASLSAETVEHEGKMTVLLLHLCIAALLLLLVPCVTASGQCQLQEVNASDVARR